MRERCGLDNLETSVRIYLSYTNMQNYIYAEHSSKVISGVISQNENVGRASTSERVVLDMRRKDRRTPMKVLVAKTFKFVG